MSISLTPLYKGDGDRDSKGELTEPWASPIISSLFSPLPFGSPKGGYMTLGSNCHLYVRQPVPGPMPEKGTYYLQKKSRGYHASPQHSLSPAYFRFQRKKAGKPQQLWHPVTGAPFLDPPPPFCPQPRGPLFPPPPPPPPPWAPP